MAIGVPSSGIHIPVSWRRCVHPLDSGLSRGVHLIISCRSGQQLHGTHIQMLGSCPSMGHPDLPARGTLPTTAMSPWESRTQQLLPKSSQRPRAGSGIVCSRGLLRSRCWEGTRGAMEEPPRAPCAGGSPANRRQGIFFLPRSLLSSLSAEMAMPGCSELTIIAAV